MTMKTKKRWLESVLKASKVADTRMPWERGIHRTEPMPHIQTPVAHERLSA